MHPQAGLRPAFCVMVEMSGAKVMLFPKFTIHRERDDVVFVKKNGATRKKTAHGIKINGAAQQDVAAI